MDEIFFPRFDPALPGAGSWGLVGERLLEDRRLDMSTRAIGAWLSVRPETWVLHGTHLVKVLGISRDVWLTARKQLIASGYLSCEKPRLPGGAFGDRIYRFDPHGLGNFTRVGFTNPGPTNPGATWVGAAGRLTEPSTTRPSTTRPPPRARKTRGPEEVRASEQVRSALATTVAVAGLGARLADLLTNEERERVDKAGAGASVEQLQLAEGAVRAGVSGGTVRSVAALAVSLGQLAARGEVGEVAPAAPAPAAVRSNPWPARQQYAGWTVEHQHGTLVVQPGALQFQHRGGDRDGQLVGGAHATQVWKRIDDGELELRPAASS